MKTLHPNSPWLLFRRDQDPKLKIEKLQSLGETMNESALTPSSTGSMVTSPSISESQSMSQNEEEDVVDLSPTSSLRTLKTESMSNNILDYSKQSSAVSALQSANKNHHQAAPSFQPITDVSSLTNHFASHSDVMSYEDHFSSARNAKDRRIFNSITGNMEGPNVDVNTLQNLVTPLSYNTHGRSFTAGAPGSRSTRVETEI